METKKTILHYHAVKHSYLCCQFNYNVPPLIPVLLHALSVDGYTSLGICCAGKDSLFLADVGYKWTGGLSCSINIGIPLLGELCCDC